MDGFLQRLLDIFNHQFLNMTPERRVRKFAVDNTLAGNAKTDRELTKSTPLNNLSAVMLKRREDKMTDEESEEDIIRRQRNRLLERNDSNKILREAATDEIQKYKEEIRRCSSVPAEVESSRNGDIGERSFDGVSNLLTMPSVSVTNLLEEIEADLPSSYSLVNVLDHTLHSVTNLRTCARLSRVGTNSVHTENNEKMLQNTEFDHINKIKNLKRESFIQKTLIEQADKAVSLCKARKKNLDLEDLESVRILLMAKLRYEAINVELQKLTLPVIGERKEENSGELEISDIWFTVNYSEIAENCNFICIVYHREKLFASQLQNEVINGKLHFPVNFKFEDLRQNFIIYLELYQLNCGSKSKRELKVRDWKNLMKLAIHKKSGNNETKSDEKDFDCIGTGSLKLSHVRSREKEKVLVHFNAGYYSAFGRMAMVKLRTQVVLNTNINGFLDLFKDFCWHRLWCSPTSYALQFWCYPEDKENGKAPVESILLPHCRENVQSVGLDVCIRPHSFMIEYKESEKGILLSASSHKEMLNWIKFLKSAIRSFEAWTPDL